MIVFQMSSVLRAGSGGRGTKDDPALHKHSELSFCYRKIAKGHVWGDLALVGSFE